MGGGHVSRPDFGMPQPDAAYPLTEFYLLAQQALEKSLTASWKGTLSVWDASGS